MGRTKILTKKNKVILYKKLTDYLKEVLDDEENFSTFEDLYKEAERVKVYGNIKYLTPALITEWLTGLPVGTVYMTYDICVMILGFLNLDKSYAGKLGDDSIYVESQTDIDSYYWEALGDIIYLHHFKSLYKAGKPSKYQKGKEKTRNEAIEWQSDFATHNYSYGELAYFSDYFETKARRYGLLREFRENGII